MARPESGEPLVGVFGGSGFYDLFADAHDVVELSVETPFGPAAAPIAVGTFGSGRVAFMPRHGRLHRYAAHRVPYRANVWAMHAAGVRAIVAPCAAGSLRPDIAPGELVVVDQLIDRTWGRPDTFHDVGSPDSEPGAAGSVFHQPFAEPYDAELRALLVDAARGTGATVTDGGTMVVINGPRFSTRAESEWFRSMGGHVVNMTGYPEAVLAAELGIRYATVALVTDRDAGVDGQPPVTMEQVFATLAANVARIREVIRVAVPGVARLLAPGIGSAR